MKDIKTKQSIQNIKSKDSKGNFNHFVKQQAIHSKRDEKEKSESRAADNYTQAAKSTIRQANYRGRKFIKTKIKDHKLKQQIKSGDKEVIQPQKINFISKTKERIMDKARSTSHSSIFLDNPIINNIEKTFTALKEVTIKVATNINMLLSLGSGIIIAVVLTLFIGTFAVFAQDGGVNSEITALSTEVLAYEETITKYAKEYDIEEYISIIQAIMMQESKGIGTDPMQCSECIYNTKYPRIPNGIKNAEYSIECGIKTFKECLKQAKVKNSSDTEKLYLAIQGYNYGNNYIEWAITQFGGYSKYNAQVYSDNMKKQLNLNTYGDPNYVDHVMQYVGFTFRGGTNPNFNNMEAWATRNPYAKASLYGQCTWFAWGRFYELYGYDPGFTGNGWDCVDQLIASHPDKFVRSTVPKAGAIFSGIGKNHVGIVISVNNNTLTIQEGNLDGITNTFQDAKKDWHTTTYTLDGLRTTYKGVIFANPK